MLSKFSILLVGFVTFTQAIQIRDTEAVSTEVASELSSGCGCRSKLRPAIQGGATLLTNGFIDDFGGATFECNLEKLPLNYGNHYPTIQNGVSPYYPNCDAWISPYVPGTALVTVQESDRFWV